MEVEEKEMLDVFNKLQAFLAAIKSPDGYITAAIQHLDEVCYKNLNNLFSNYCLKKRISLSLLFG